MAIPLVGYGLAALGLGGFGWLGLSIASEVVFWGSAALALIVFGRTLQVLVMDRPVELFDGTSFNNLSYLFFSAALAYIAFQLIQVMFVVSGIGIALLSVLVAGAMFIFGAGVVVNGIAGFVLTLLKILRVS